MIFGKRRIDPMLALQQKQLHQEQTNSEYQLANQEEEIRYAKQENQDLLRWQQDLIGELEELKHDLLREYYDPATESWKRETQTVLINGKYKTVELPPLLNQRGIRMIETLIRPLLSRNLINSNLEEEMIFGILRRTADTLANNIVHFHEEYNLEFGNWDYVMRLVLNVMIPTPFRASKGWTKRMDSTISKRLETHNQGFNHNNESKGAFARLIGR